MHLRHGPSNLDHHRQNGKPAWPRPGWSKQKYNFIETTLKVIQSKYLKSFIETIEFNNSYFRTTGPHQFKQMILLI